MNKWKLEILTSLLSSLRLKVNLVVYYSFDYTLDRFQ